MSSPPEFNEPVISAYQLLYITLTNIEDIHVICQTEPVGPLVLELQKIKTNLLISVNQILEIADVVSNNESEHNSDTTLHLAVKIENIEILELLLLKRADVNAKNDDLETPLHLALRRQSTDIVQILLRNGADPKIVNGEGYSSFHFLIKFCNDRMINIFLENEVVFDFKLPGREFLEIAVAKNSVKMVQLVFAHSNRLKEEDINGSSLVHLAVENGNIEIVKLLFENGFNVNETLDSGITPLQIAVREKFENIVQFLLDNNADVNSRDINGTSILHQAVEQAYPNFSKLSLDDDVFLENGAADSYDESNTVTDRGFRKILKLLLEHGADINVKDAEGFMPLHRAVESSKKEVVRLLLEKGCDINAITTNDSFTPLHLLVNLDEKEYSEDSDSLLKYLLENGANVKAEDDYGMIPLLHAIERERLNLVSVFLDNTDPHDKDNKLAFCLSFLRDDYVDDDSDYEDDNSGDYHDSFKVSRFQNQNRKTVAEVFFERGYTLDLEDFKDFHVPEGMWHYMTYHLKSSNFVEGVLNFLQKTANNPAEVVRLGLQYKVLQGSVKRGFMSIINNLLTPAMDVNAKLHTGRSLLHIASRHGRLPVVEELLKRKANVNDVDNDAMSALHFSAKNNHAHVAKFLLESKANLEARNIKNQTPLYLAVEKKSYKSFRLLLNLGANINVVDVKGMSPLHAAVKTYNPLYIEILLHYGARANDENLTPLFDSETDLSVEIIELLFNHGAQMSGLIDHPDYDDYVNFLIKSIVIEVDNSDIPENSTIADFRIKCQREIKRMKLMRFAGFNVSLHDMFVKHDRRIAMYMRNENIIEMVKLMDFEKLFPIFANKLRTRLIKGRSFNQLVELGYYCLESLLKLKVPVIIKNEIFSYLSEADIHRLIIAAPIDSEEKASVQYKD